MQKNHVKITRHAHQINSAHGRRCINISRNEKNHFTLFCAHAVAKVYRSTRARKKARKNFWKKSLRMTSWQSLIYVIYQCEWSDTWHRVIIRSPIDNIRLLVWDVAILWWVSRNYFRAFFKNGRRGVIMSRGCAHGVRLHSFVTRDVRTTFSGGRVHVYLGIDLSWHVYRRKCVAGLSVFEIGGVATPGKKCRCSA